MTNHLSPEQEDPEQRIRELERGLADIDQPAAQYPDVSPTAGPMPSWSPAPAPSGSPGGSTFGQKRGGLRWTGTLVGFVFSIAMILVFTVPWKDLGVFGNLFGPTKVPQGGSLTVNESNKTKTIECNDGRLTLNGNNLAVTVTGHCANLLVNGSDHQVTVDSADSIAVNGRNSIVIYHSGEPQVSTNGSVKVMQG